MRNLQSFVKHITRTLASDKNSSSPALFPKIIRNVWLLLRRCGTEAGGQNQEQDPQSTLASPLALPAVARLSSARTASPAPVACSAGPGLSVITYAYAFTDSPFTLCVYSPYGWADVLFVWQVSLPGFRQPLQPAAPQRAHQAVNWKKPSIINTLYLMLKGILPALFTVCSQARSLLLLCRLLAHCCIPCNRQL